jgi:hypothetical protein
MGHLSRKLVAKRFWKCLIDDEPKSSFPSLPSVQIRFFEQKATKKTKEDKPA